MSLTLYLIIFITICSFMAFQRPILLQKLSLNPYSVFSAGEYYRLVTSTFVHADLGHLLFNMVSLYFFGEYVERYCYLLFGISGGTLFFVLFLSSGVVADIHTLIKYRGDINYHSLGASGSVAAIVFASILFEPLQSITFIFFPIPIPGFIFGLLYLLYSYYQAKKNTDHINHTAHFYGALSGIIFFVIFEPSLIPIFFEKVSRWSLL